MTFQTEERTTLWDRLRAAMFANAKRRRLIAWLAPTVITLVAGILRLINLGHPDQLAFDETYYVKDAWSLWELGYEGTWDKDANPAFEQGDTSGLSDRGSFIVHPPLGKWIIAVGMGLLGQGSSFGWRLTTALVGTGLVLLLYFFALLVSRSIVVSSVASGLLAIDGLGIVMSRTALLDISLAFFILLGTYFVVLDRRRSIPIIERSAPANPEPLWGRVLWRRPWLLAAGVALGAATAVKWSGMYAIVGLGIYIVVDDALARRRAGVQYWPMDAVARQGAISALLVVPVAVVTYLATWTGWLVTAGGYARDRAENAFVSLWEYHIAIYNFHINLSSGHPYASPAWQWPLLLRPTAVWVGDNEGVTCWNTDHCIAVISTIPNPVVWYAAFAASAFLIYLIVRAIIKRQSVSWELAVPLVGLAITWLPWLAIPHRTMYQFYSITMLPFVLLALALVLRHIAGSRAEPFHRRSYGQRWIWTFLIIAVIVSIFFYPVWTGAMVPYEFWLIHNWIPSWI